eukprot:SM000019S05019  [mRNA]  locus=s19:522768:523625:+ [translate_table: standard]
MRQAFGLVCGVAWGAIPLHGGAWFFVYVLLSMALVFSYYKYYLRVDEEEFGGHAALLQEGLVAAVGLFMVSLRVFSGCSYTAACTLPRRWSRAFASLALTPWWSRTPTCQMLIHLPLSSLSFSFPALLITESHVDQSLDSTLDLYLQWCTSQEQWPG